MNSNCFHPHIQSLLEMINPAHKSSFTRNPNFDVEEPLHVSKAFALEHRSLEKQFYVSKAFTLGDIPKH